MVTKMIKYLVRKICAISLILTMVNLTTILPSQAFTIGEEREVGEKLLYTVRSAFDVLDDPDIHRYINDLGVEVLEVAGIQFFDYHFFVIKNKEFNAFAAPSGLIFFYSGLIETMNSEDELVSVLAHEIGHVVKRHLASRLEKGKVVNMATLALALGSLALGSAEATQAVLAGSIAAGQSVNLHFSRLDEEEADLLAYRWMKELGRSPEYQEKMLQTMRRITRYRMGQVPQYLLTHPNPEMRMEYVQSLLDADQAQVSSFGKTEQFDFLRFKYRILSMVKTGSTLRDFLASKIADPMAKKEEMIMAKYGIAQLDRVEKNYDNSLKMLDDVIQSYPQKTILQVDKGIVEFESGRLEQARKTLTSVHSRNTNDLYSSFALAKVYFSMKDLARAEKLFLTVAGGMPEYSKVYFQLGKLKSQQKRNGDASYYLGKYYLYEGKHKLAAPSFKAAIKDEATDESLKKDAKESLELLKRLQKD